MEKVYIARDGIGQTTIKGRLWIFEKEPVFDYGRYVWTSDKWGDELDKDKFPEISNGSFRVFELVEVEDD